MHELLSVNVKLDINGRLLFKFADISGLVNFSIERKNSFNEKIDIHTHDNFLQDICSVPSGYKG